MTLPAAPSLHRLAFLGNHPPRVCGLATFTADLRAAVAGAAPGAECFTLAMTDGAGPYAYPAEVRLEIPEADPRAYLRAADFLDDTNTDVLCVQHEYGIFGGPDGELLLPLLERTRLPVVTTLHTVLERPTAGQRRVMEAIVRRSARLVVMTQRSREIMAAIHSVSQNRLAVVPHGIPDVPFENPELPQARTERRGPDLAAHLRPASPEQGHRARDPRVAGHRGAATRPALRGAGATHPNLLRREGEAYRASLVRLAERLGVADHVRFLDRFVDLPALTRAVAAADIYLTPYLHEAQSVSGTLSYSFGMGKPVVSTPYWHAAELLADGRGVLVPFADPAAIAAGVLGLLDEPARMNAMRGLPPTGRGGSSSGRVSASGTSRSSATRARERQRPDGPPGPFRPIRFPHRPASGSTSCRPCGWTTCGDCLIATGIAQHAVHAVVDRAHGYCLDDNARGLILATHLCRMVLRGGSLLTEDLFASTAAFVLHAWNGEAGRFRNFMGYDRRWLEDAGSEDSHGRAVWALGTVVGRTGQPAGPGPAAFWSGRSRLSRASPPRAPGPSRSWAWSTTWRGNPVTCASSTCERCWPTGCLHRLRANRGEGWTWFEDVLAYDNARLPQALVAAGRQAERADWRDEALDALRWLCAVQTTDGGSLPPDRLERLLAPRRRAGGLRPAAAGSRRRGRRLPRGMARHAQPALAGRGKAGLRLVSRHQRPRSAACTINQPEVAGMACSAIG